VNVYEVVSKATNEEGDTSTDVSVPTVEVSKAA
jgi:hypothetical protein